MKKIRSSKEYTVVTYQETLSWLHSMPRTHSAPTLSRVKALLSMVGDPQNALSGRFLHVTGTNGKGSTCAFLSSALRAQGYRVGRFISPFIMEFRERMEINGEQISEDEVCEIGAELQTVVNRYTSETGQAPLEFELVTVMGLLYFARHACDLVVLEVGIGGMYDPTNIVTPLLSVIMRVDYDHTELLGDTLAAIAEQKAGIIKPGAPCILYADNEDEVISVIRSRCDAVGASLVIPDMAALSIGGARPGRLAFTYCGQAYLLQLSGIYQVRNALCAIEALRLLPSLGFAMDADAIVQGLAAAHFPARFEVLSQDPPILLDGAHNASGMEALAENIDFYYPDRPLLYLCGMLGDKQPEASLEPILRPQTVRFCACVTPPSPRAMKADALCRIFRSHGIDAAPYETMEAALDALRAMRAEMCCTDDTETHPILCFGSLYSAGDIRRLCGLETENEHADV